LKVAAVSAVFSADNRYTGDKDRPVDEAVLLELDAATGRLLRKWAHRL